MIRLRYTMFFLGFPLLCLSQSTEIVKSGRIEYERKINSYGILRDKFLPLGGEVNNPYEAFYEAYKKSYPQFSESYFTLFFNRNKSIYRPLKVEKYDPQKINFLAAFGYNNIVFSDANTDSTFVVRDIVGTSYITSVNARVKWRITNEKREILGYECRRANGVFLDSVYVVAFYTDQIASTAGPESFSGLPGAILQVSVPFDYVSWTAVKIDSVNKISDDSVSFATSGTSVKKSAWDEILKDAINKNFARFIDWVYMFSNL